MPTLTTNYAFQLPVVGADDDVWGDFLNANWSALDTQLFSGSIGANTTGNAATATTATTATSAVALATARTLTIGDTGKTFDGSADVAWTLGEIGVTLASQAQAEAGTDNSVYMTPLRTAQAIEKLSPAPSELTEAQATDDTSTVFGTVSGERLEQQTNAAFNVTGAAPKYACRAWVNFNGTGTVAIVASGNVSSITDNGTGDYTVNFTAALPDGDFVLNVLAGSAVSGGSGPLSASPHALSTYARTTTSVRFVTRRADNSNIVDATDVSVAIFR